MDGRFLSCSFILLAFISSCGRPQSTRIKGSASTYSIETLQEKLDSNLVNGVITLVNETKEKLKFPEIPIEDSFIIVHFKVLPESRNINFSDSIIDIYYNSANLAALLLNDYKGMFNIKGYNVAIIDTGNFGNKYYNPDSLKQEPLSNYKSIPTKVVSTIRYYTEDGVLNRWNP